MLYVLEETGYICSLVTSADTYSVSLSSEISGNIWQQANNKALALFAFHTFTGTLMNVLKTNMKGKS